MMDKLMSYAVTPRALQILLKSPNEPTCMPDGWFNWTHPKTTSLGGPETQRLELVSFADGARSIGIWNNKAHASGYACALLVAMDEGTHVIDIKGLRGDVVYQLVTESPVDDSFNKRLLEQLREPESILSIYWDELRRGGGGNLDVIGFQNVTVWQWWLYGKAIQHWIQQTTRGESRAAELRQVTPDFKAWNNWKHLGMPNIKLNLEKSWNSPQERIWPWSLSNPCTVSDIPTLEKDGLAAYYPMRQSPFSGIARRLDGTFTTMGALPDEKGDDGNWIWDNGSIRGALTTSQSNMYESVRPDVSKVGMSPNPSIIQQSSFKKEVPSVSEKIQAIVDRAQFQLLEGISNIEARHLEIADDDSVFGFCLVTYKLPLDNLLSETIPNYEQFRALQLEIVIYGKKKPTEPGPDEVAVSIGLVDPHLKKRTTTKKINLSLVSGNNVIELTVCQNQKYTHIINVTDYNLALCINSLHGGNAKT